MTLRIPTTLIRPPAYHDPRDPVLRDAEIVLGWKVRVMRNWMRKQEKE